MVSLFILLSQGTCFYTRGSLKFSLSYLVGAAAKSLQSCRTLFDPLDGSPPGSPVPGILQARTLEWAAISFSRGSSNPGIEPMSLSSPALTGKTVTPERPMNYFTNLEIVSLKLKCIPLSYSLH